MLGPLQGFTIAVTADRRAAEQAELLERRGARVLAAPCIRTLAVSEEHAAREATAKLLARHPDYLVANTGVGIRGWFAAAASWGLEGELTAALRHTRIASRGPKAAGAITTAGLDVWWRAPTERLDEVVRHLLAHDLRGARVAVQRAGDDRNPCLEPLTSAGADVVEIPVYRWTAPEDGAPAERLAQAIADGTVDAVTFTSPPTVRLFFDRLDAREFNRRVLAVAVGPVTKAALADAGLDERRVVAPERGRLGTMVRTMEDALRSTAYELAPGVVVQGRTVANANANANANQAVTLTDQERAILDQLRDRPGVPVSKQRLRAALAVDERALEAAVHRLRKKLVTVAPGAALITTLPRRGYALADLTSGASGL